VRTGGDVGGAKAVRAAGGIRGAHALALMQGGECGGNLPQPGRRCWRAIAGGLLLGRMVGDQGRVDENSGHGWVPVGGASFKRGRRWRR